MNSASSLLGSSPHARGARGPSRRMPCASRDHPRMRGEHLCGLEAVGPLGGIIPACAGSTTNFASCQTIPRGSSPHARGAQNHVGDWKHSIRDHPRMRGEHASVVIVAVFGKGIIPACAGSTGLSSTARTRLTGSSPHARGARRENGGFAQCDRNHPRMRGEHSLASRRGAARVGIIPACAGSTIHAHYGMGGRWGSSPHARGALGSRERHHACSRDHPRMRGEHSALVQRVGEQAGIIPACAGSTWHVGSMRSASMGSSPHARGAPGPCP